ncbi:MAG: hypothetical protein ACM36B_05440, partial [Bacteroidota bacterium]
PVGDLTLKGFQHPVTAYNVLRLRDSGRITRNRTSTAPGEREDVTSGRCSGSQTAQQTGRSLPP